MAHGNDLVKKRYFFLRLQDNFFSDIRVKKLRKLAGGDTYTIIYLKLMLLSLRENGRLVYEGVYNTIGEEMAEKINEESRVEDVGLTLNFLISEGILEATDNGDYAFNNLPIGSETQAAIYKRKVRGLENVQPMSNQCLTNIEYRDKSIEYRDKNLDIKENILKESSTRFVKPTLEQVEEYVKEKEYHIDPSEFIDFYESKGWFIGKNKMKNWKSAINTWERNYLSRNPKVEEKNQDDEINAWLMKGMI